MLDLSSQSLDFVVCFIVDDYNLYLDKYSSVRNDFESKMLDSCGRLQQIEESHLEKMKDFVDTYALARVHHTQKVEKVAPHKT